MYIVVYMSYAARTLCSEHTVPRETGVVCGEALCDALVPVHRWVSTSDGSRELPSGPFVWVVVGWLC